MPILASDSFGLTHALELTKLHHEKLTVEEREENGQKVKLTRKKQARITHSTDFRKMSKEIRQQFADVIGKARNTISVIVNKFGSEDIDNFYNENNLIMLEKNVRTRTKG